MKAAVIAIGDELLNGQTVDTNSAWLGRHLNDIGVDLIEATRVGDDIGIIESSLKRLARRVDLIITTGGLGPTHDDVTKKALSNFTNTPLVFHPEMYEGIQSYFRRIYREPTELHRRQCYLPRGCVLFPNSKGTAPGMGLVRGNVKLLSLPGVPYEMQDIMAEEGLKWIRGLSEDTQAISHFVIHTTGIGETHLAKRIEPITSSFPRDVSIAYLPGLASVKLRVSARGKDASSTGVKSVEWGEKIVRELGTSVYGIGETTLSEAVGNLCLKKNITLGTAESCTGGYVAHMITQVPGSSAYFEGSVVTYSNDLKVNVLSVKKSTLEKHGAVSEATVKEMVSGLLAVLKVDVAVAISGIAGPGGGTADKPVGTVWIAVGNKQRIETHLTHVAKDRILNIQYASVRALNQLRLFIMENM